MSAVLPLPSECCCNETGNNGSGGIPNPGPIGPQGPIGPVGPAGKDGKNAFTNLSAGFTQPAVGATVPITVVDGTFVNLGQDLHIEFGGVYLVTGKTDFQHITIQNIGATGNLAPGNLVPNGSQVSPSGEPGPKGLQGDQGVPGNPGPPGAAGSFQLMENRAAMKAMPTPIAAVHPMLIFLKNPEPGVNKTYISEYGSAVPADDENVIEPTDHLCRYFWYDL